MERLFYVVFKNNGNTPGMNNNERFGSVDFYDYVDEFDGSIKTGEHKLYSGKVVARHTCAEYGVNGLRAWHIGNNDRDPKRKAWCCLATYTFGDSCIKFYESIDGHSFRFRQPSLSNDVLFFVNGGVGESTVNDFCHELRNLSFPLNKNIVIPPGFSYFIEVI